MISQGWATPPILKNALLIGCWLLVLAAGVAFVESLAHSYSGEKQTGKIAADAIQTVEAEQHDNVAQVLLWTGVTASILLVSLLGIAACGKLQRPYVHFGAAPGGGDRGRANHHGGTSPFYISLKRGGMGTTLEEIVDWVRGAAVISRQSDVTYMKVLARNLADTGSKTSLGKHAVAQVTQRADAEHAYLAQNEAQDEEDERVTTMEVRLSDHCRVALSLEPPLRTHLVSDLSAVQVIGDHTRGEVEGLLAMLLLGVGIEQLLQSLFLVGLVLLAFSDDIGLWALVRT